MKTKENYVMVIFDNKNGMFFVTNTPTKNDNSYQEFSTKVDDNIDMDFILDNIKVFNYQKVITLSKEIIRKENNIHISTEIYKLSHFVEILSKHRCNCNKFCKKIIPFKNGSCYNLPNVGIIRPVCFDKISTIINNKSPFKVEEFINNNYYRHI